MARKKHLINVHTGTGTTAPTNASLYLGEIAVQHTPENPALWIKMGTSEASTDYEKFIGETEIHNEFKKTNHNIPYVEQSGNVFTGTASTYTAVCNELTGLTDGQSIIFHPKRNSSASTVYLNITFADGVTTSGNKIIYLQGSSKVTTHLKGCSDVKLTYHNNATCSGTTGLDGWWVDFYYDSNTTPSQLYGLGKIKADKAIPRYTLSMQTSAGTWNSITTNGVTGNTSSATTKGFLLGSDVVYYTGSGGIAAGGTGASGSGYVAVNSLDFRYSSNNVNLTAGLPVYLVGTVNQTDGLFYLDETTWWTQTLPTTENGKVYIYLGNANSSNTLGLHEEHPIYEYKNGHIRIYQEDNNTLGPSYTYSGLPYVNSATTVADAYSAITKMLIDDEKVIAEAFNQQNDRILAMSGDINTINEKIDNFHVDMILGSGYTYSGIPYVNSATTIADAYSALTQEVIDNEEVTAEALNDLNDRIIEISGNVANIHVDMILGSGYTFSGLPYVNSATSIADAYSALTNELFKDEEVISAAFNDLNDRIDDIHVDMILGSGYTYSGIPYVNSATTIADAYSALTNEVILDELVFASAVNDLNDRVDTKIETIVGDSGMLPNVVYELGTVGGSAAFELAPPTKTNILNHYYWTFDTGTLTPTVTWPSGISKWAGNCVQNGSPVLVANAHYEVSVMDGYAFIVGV